MASIGRRNGGLSRWNVVEQRKVFESGQRSATTAHERIGGVLQCLRVADPIDEGRGYRAREARGVSKDRGLRGTYQNAVVIPELHAFVLVSCAADVIMIDM